MKKVVIIDPWVEYHFGLEVGMTYETVPAPDGLEEGYGWVYVYSEKERCPVRIFEGEEFSYVTSEE
ncbi:hypothetical protein [Siphonobacter aquaeclarae]|uniref:Uncharacterized protein n=1 Tax=Siphonobacter aquaeclarae TaxID=563176 RepID=A0A1G9TAL3_9BACT|nr:hypothetical protein [Siphonobacter aquaeclarae]SDM44145.1 hypothetical protein SAMN04488090_3463 [Siphonobacter aquaeclarae]